MADLIDPDEFVDGEAKTIAEHRDRNVFAVRGGKVTRVGWERPGVDEEGLGYRIWLKAPDGTEEVYGQMEPGSVLFRVGQRVEEGEHLGRFADNAPDADFLYGVRDGEGNWLDPESSISSAEARPDQHVAAITATGETEEYLGRRGGVDRRPPQQPYGNYGKLLHGRCLDACASKDFSKGQRSWHMFCNAIPDLQEMEKCRTHAFDSETKCRNYCFNAFGKH